MLKNLLKIDISNSKDETEDESITVKIQNEDVVHINFQKFYIQSKYIRDKYKYCEALVSLQNEIDEMEEKFNIGYETMKIFIELIEEEKVNIPIELYKDFYTLSLYFCIPKLTSVLDNICQEYLCKDLNFSIQLLIYSETATNNFETKMAYQIENFLMSQINKCFKNSNFGKLSVSTIFRMLDRSKEKIDQNLLNEFIFEEPNTRFILFKFIQIHELTDENVESFIKFIDEQEEHLKKMYLEYIPFDFSFFKNIKNKYNQLLKEFNQTKQELNQTKQELNQTKQELNQTKQEFKQTKQEFNQTKQELNQTKQELNQTKIILEQAKEEPAKAPETKPQPPNRNALADRMKMFQQPPSEEKPTPKKESASTINQGGLSFKERLRLAQMGGQIQNTPPTKSAPKPAEPKPTPPEKKPQLTEKTETSGKLSIKDRIRIQQEQLRAEQEDGGVHKPISPNRFGGVAKQNMAIMGRPFPGKPKPSNKLEQDTNIETVVEVPKIFTRRGLVYRKQAFTCQAINKLLDEGKTDTTTAQESTNGGSSMPNSSLAIPGRRLPTAVANILAEVAKSKPSESPVKPLEEQEEQKKISGPEQKKNKYNKRGKNKYNKKKKNKYNKKKKDKDEKNESDNSSEKEDKKKKDNDESESDNSSEKED